MHRTALARLPWSQKASPLLNTYLIVAHDAPAPLAASGSKGPKTALERRLNVREEHLADARKGKEAGRIIIGGALLGCDWDDLPEEGARAAMVGSAMIVRGESIDDVRQRLSRDAYVRKGVFDPTKTFIYPFASALPATSVRAPFSALDADAEAADLAYEAARRTEEARLRRDYGLAALRAAPGPQIPYTAPSLGLTDEQIKQVEQDKATLGQLRSSPPHAGQQQQGPGVTLQGLRAMHTLAYKRPA